ncbi:NUDIX domain-containing protein [Terracoccus sp. 273MFTsu3.1]|uniref:NUDIX domain-containing protein n=1 Tax=Terracoccus sp. 273MFTsu3.1 TaxID=1172188 RepID=UPI000371B185|nr:NUDIX hydrolase [Terracoccus sp. 273MFTsu3.1]
MSWPVRATTVVYENPWIRVREDAVTRPDGTDGIYGVIELQRPAVFVVALTDADEVVLVTVDRHTVGTSVEVPAGGTDGEDPLVAARRELAEETGLVARDWRQVGTMNALNGVCRAPEVVFLATGLEPAHGARDTAARAEEGIREVRRVPVREVIGLVRDGAISDGETIAALMLALVALGRVS